MLDRPTPAEPPPGLPKEEIEALQKTILGLARLLAPEQDAHAYAAFATIWAAIVRLCWLAVAHALRQTVAQRPGGDPSDARQLRPASKIKRFSCSPVSTVGSM